jgi:thiol-disulfide isomerase/thioredoxin
VRVKGFRETEQKLETFLKELAAKEKTESRTQLLLQGRFFLFFENAKHAEASPENFSKFKAELKTWINQEVEFFETILSLGFEMAFKNKVPAEQIVKELSESIRGCKLPAEIKKEMIAVLEAKAHLAPGVDPKLYGKTLDDKDFQWESLRGKYVLVKFTATWCGPCKMQIPGLLDAYKKYHDKGLEIISVYVFEHSADPVASVKQVVDEEKLPWIILSEALSEKAKHPNYGEFYGIEGVPTIVLVDKEGKIMMPATHGDEWKTKLEEICK